MTEDTPQAPQPGPMRAKDFDRGLMLLAPFEWLKLGVRDTLVSPVSSLVYGFSVFLISATLVGATVRFDFSYILFPLIAGFMILGPMIAIGLYGKSKLLAEGVETVSLTDMLKVRAKSPGQLLFVGLFLMLVMTFWLRAAVMLYALFFGLEPFGSLEETVNTLLFTSTGQSLLAVGSVVGGLLAAFSFSLSAFSIPMLMNEKKDTMSAMALSVVMAWTNKPAVFVWGCIVLALFVVSVATGFIGFIVIYPILGHGTWHAYQAVRTTEALAAAELDT